jgi:pimeloyl-ACP methyl ester carboxylesterase
VNVIDRGQGTPVLLVHGSAADSTTWTIQLASLRKQMRLIAYDRRDGVRTVAEHASDAVAILDQRAIRQAVVCGSSFGGIVALEIARRHGARVTAAVICEPPLPCGDTVPRVAAGFGCAYDRAAALRGDAAGEMFLRHVLGPDAFAAIPRAFRERAAGRWRQIRDDALALASYPLRYADLGAVWVPTLLLGGDRSAPWYRDTLETLAAHLPRARLEVLRGAGHMLHADAARTFNARLVAWASEHGPG